MRRLELTLILGGLFLGGTSVYVCLVTGELYMAGVFTGAVLALAAWAITARLIPFIADLFELWSDWLILYHEVHNNPDRVQMLRQLAEHLSPAEFSDAVRCIAAGDEFEDGASDIFPEDDPFGPGYPDDDDRLTETDPGEQAMQEHYRLYRSRRRK